MQVPILRALSIWQPWAWLIAQGFKDIENREWHTHVRGWVLIHASKHRMSRADYASAEMMAQRNGVTLPLREACPFGAFVGAMRIDEVMLRSASPWFVGPYGFRIGAAKAFAEPVEAIGNLGFFYLPLTEPLRVQVEAVGLTKELERGFAA